MQAAIPAASFQAGTTIDTAGGLHPSGSGPTWLAAWRGAVAATSSARPTNSTITGTTSQPATSKRACAALT